MNCYLLWPTMSFHYQLVLFYEDSKLINYLNYLFQVVDSDDEWETLCEHTDSENNSVQACLFLEQTDVNFVKKLRSRLHSSMLQVKLIKIRLFIYLFTLKKYY